MPLHAPATEAWHPSPPLHAPQQQLAPGQPGTAVQQGGTLAGMQGGTLMPPVSGGLPSDPSSYQQTHFGASALVPASSGGLSTLASGLAVSPALGQVPGVQGGQHPQQRGPQRTAASKAAAPASFGLHTAAFGGGGGGGGFSGGQEPEAAAAFAVGNRAMLDIDRHGSSALPPVPEAYGGTMYSQAAAAAPPDVGLTATSPAYSPAAPGGNETTAAGDLPVAGS